MDKIAFAVHKYLGLSETFIYESLRSIKSYEAIVLTQAKENLDKFPFSSVYSISDLPFYNKFTENLTNHFGRFSYFKNIVKEQRIKLIHAQFAWDGIFMLPLKRFFNIPLVTSFRGIDIYKYPNDRFYRWRLKQLFSEGDCFIAISRKIAEKAVSLGCPEGKIKVLYGGIDLNKFEFIPRREKEEINILMCGRLVEKKGFAYGVKAFANSFKIHRNIRLKIIGEGPQEKDLKSLIKELGIEKVVALAGRQTHQQVVDATRQADIFMMSFVTAKDGSSEGIPNVLKEAQATGLPTLSTYHAGVPEVVSDGETGFLVEERDTDGLTQKLTQLIENPSLRARFGEKGRKLIEEKFDVVVQTQKMEDIYKKLINA
jgi:glycosyltransferase involved in cell wall biosynthesis